MVTAGMVLVVVAMGINYGWQPVEPNSQDYEYIVQIEPELVDAIADGQSLELESNVPDQIRSIRRVRITVGKSDLPRVMAQASSEIQKTSLLAEDKKPSEPYVVNLAGDDAWSSEPATTGAGENRVYQQIGPAIGSSPTAQSVMPGPGPVVDRFGNAIRETGRTLRDAVEYGVDKTGQQLQRSGGQALQTMENAGQGIGQGLDDTRRALQNSIAEPFGTSQAQYQIEGPPPANWRADDGWTSVTPNLAAPPLANPSLDPYETQDWTHTADDFQFDSDSWSVKAASNVESPRPQQPTTNRNASQNPAPTNNDWPSPNAPGSIDRYTDSTWPQTSREEGSDLSGLVPVRRNEAPAPSKTPAATGPKFADWPEDDDWNSKPPQPKKTGASDRYAVGSPSQQNKSGNWRDLPDESATAAEEPTLKPPALPSDLPAMETPSRGGAVVVAERSPSEMPVSVRQTSSASPPAGKSEPIPWMPFLAVSVALVGSFGANVFLGWSYLDARQKYRTMIGGSRRPGRYDDGPDDDDFEESKSRYDEKDYDDEDEDEEEDDEPSGKYQTMRRRRSRRQDR